MGISDTFYHRKVSEGGTWLLMVDYMVTCYDEAGGINADYLVYIMMVSVVVMCLLWSLGVPAYFGWWLYTHHKIIQARNADFAGIAPLRPLFMFFKPDCYMFEIYFMLEKLVMTGVVRLLRVYSGDFFVARPVEDRPGDRHHGLHTLHAGRPPAEQDRAVQHHQRRLALRHAVHADLGDHAQLPD
jgi:hypothetical protein